jgi:type IV pilus assembly protein PilA
MLKSLLQRAREARAAELGDGEGLEEGFTLIELMVVLLIIAILLAIAIPTFLGVTSSAHDRAAQSNLTNSLTESESQYQNAQNYSFAATGGSPAQATLNSSAPEFTWVDGSTSSANQNTVSVSEFDVASTGDAQGIVLAALSLSDTTCWYVMTMQSNPVETSATPAGPAPAWTQNPGNGASAKAGTFYAHKAKASSTTCKATDGLGTGFKWGASYSDAAGAN